VGSPGDGIHTGLVALELGNGDSGKPDVQDHHFGGVHENGGHESWVLFVPAEAQERRLRLGALIDDGGVLLIAQIKHPHRAVGRNRSENAHTAPSNVVHRFVMRDELRVHHARLDVPVQKLNYYRTCRLNQGFMVFKMKNSIDLIMKNTIQMSPNFISLESVKNIVCVGQERKKFKQKDVHIGPTQNC
jgi:hypothetical protein